MLIRANFQGPPTTRDNARLYQRAVETKRLASVAEEELRARDSSKHDSNSATDAVVSPFASVPQTEVDYSRAIVSGSKEPHFGPSTRELTPDGKVKALAGSLNKDRSAMTAVFKTAELLTFEVSKQVDGSGETYSLDAGTCLKARGSAGDLRSFGDLTAHFDRLTGALFVEQKEDLASWTEENEPDSRYIVYGGDKSVRRYDSHGPADFKQQAQYASDKDDLEAAEDSLARLKALDNTSSDLNPEPGIVVTATFGEEQEEAHLHFSLENGAIHQAAIGFGDIERLTYRRDENGRERFEITDFRFATLDRETNGDLTVTEKYRADLAQVEDFHRQEAALAQYQALPWYRKLLSQEPEVTQPNLY